MSKKKKSREPVIARSVFIIGLLVEILKYSGFSSPIDKNILVIYPIFIILFSLFFSLTYIDSWSDGITNMLVGVTLYFSLTYAIVLFGTIGLDNNSVGVIEGLSRISFALFAIWKLHSDMRHTNLTLKPNQNRPKIFFFDKREFGRLLKIVFYVGLTFVFLTSGMELLKQAKVDVAYLEQTEEISTNILFVGLQSPLLMASRSSVSKTFSNFLDNYSELITRYQGNLDQLNSALKTYLNVKKLSYSEINNNGKTMWLSIILILFLQSFKEELIMLYTSINVEELLNLLLQSLPF